DGALSNFDTVKKIVEKTDAFVQVGGGIRDEERIKKYLDLGVGRVILGTAAVKNPGFLIEMVEKYKEKIAVGVDALNGKVSVGGWLETTDSDSVGFCEKLRDIGVSTAIYTDISKDGMLSGANLEIYRELAEIKGLDIIASGGVTFEDEIRSLKNMGVCGAVVGKALYEGKLSLARLLKVANG
ncbi:MAG: HisA/HisF-related TIM barrel protein, partial [Oscillospiraceae bacterium]|nr:HisA/HisF-related TIM barrel protein [Oscillospiraceae bacterium]